MDLHLFDLNLLVALDALLTERNVTKAGARLNLSQSAMSGALARLRNVFQDELLVPVGRQMILTQLAEDLVAPVRSVLLQVRETLGTKPRFEPASATRHFSLAVSDYVTAVLIADALRRAQQEAPFITFELRSIGKLADDDLERGQLDFLIAPEGFVSTLHPSEVLFEETFTCVAWAGNESIGATLSLEEYLNLPHVVVSMGSMTGVASYDEQFLRRSNYKRRVVVWAPSFSLAPQLVVGTDRVTTIQTRLAMKYSKILPLKLIPLPLHMPPMIEMLQWHKAHDHDPAQQWFRQLLKASVAALSPAPCITSTSERVPRKRAGQERGQRAAVGVTAARRRARPRA